MWEGTPMQWAFVKNNDLLVLTRKSVSTAVRQGQAAGPQGDETGRQLQVRAAEHRNADEHRRDSSGDGECAHAAADEGGGTSKTGSGASRRLAPLLACAPV